MPDSLLLDPPQPILADSGRGHGGRERSGWDGGGGGGGDGGGSSLPVNNARLLLFLGLIASTMLFSGLIGAFVVLRGATPVWPPAGTPPLPPLLWVNTALVVGSSVLLIGAHVAQRRGFGGALKLLLVLALIPAAAFLGLQVHFWRELWAAGFRTWTNNYAGNFFLLTLAHFAHAAVGFLVLVWLTLRALAGTSVARLNIATDVATILWHFVDLAWITIWILLTT
jgi:cytochrome c oxidase subunit 3